VVMNPIAYPKTPCYASYDEDEERKHSYFGCEAYIIQNIS
jgi:hypothetical protein